MCYSLWKLANTALKSDPETKSEYQRQLHENSQCVWFLNDFSSYYFEWFPQSWTYISRQFERISSYTFCCARCKMEWNKSVVRWHSTSSRNEWLFCMKVHQGQIMCSSNDFQSGERILDMKLVDFAVSGRYYKDPFENITNLCTSSLLQSYRSLQYLLASLRIKHSHIIVGKMSKNQLLFRRWECCHFIIISIVNP